MSDKATLLIELLCEELPPKSLKLLSEAFADQILNGLTRANLKSRESCGTEAFCTPRRLAVLIPDVSSKAPTRVEPRRLMPTKVAFDSSNKPTIALLKRIEKEGIPISSVQRRIDEGTEFACATLTIPGVTLAMGLQLALEEAIAKLPAPKKMRYPIRAQPLKWRNEAGSPIRWTNDRGEPIEFIADTVEFVRPVHGLVALHGDEVVSVSALGLSADRVTKGHRSLSSGSITIDHADNYKDLLQKEGRVFVSFADRRKKIKEQLAKIEDELPSEVNLDSNGRALMFQDSYVIDTERPEPPEHIFSQSTHLESVQRALECSGGSALLDEVTALVEWPKAYWGRFDETFRQLPFECLALTMKQNQKYFPVFDRSAKLLPYFVVISNNESSPDSDETERNIVSGNERVLRPRLADARFFYDNDRKVRLEARVPRLESVVFHAKLGTQRARTERLQLLAGWIARELKANNAFAERAAWLSKADLLTGMVGEFPELQGVMGRYYALNDGEPPLVANAIEQHYWPRFAGDRLPEGSVACSVALADRVDTLIGIFGNDLAPTGDKDPFALRRLAVGVIRTLMEAPNSLDLFQLLEEAFRQFSGKHLLPSTIPNLRQFILDRLRNYLREEGEDSAIVEAVLAQVGGLIYQVRSRLNAVKQFAALPEAKDLAAANKRVLNIIKKNEEFGYRFSPPSKTLMNEKAEIALMDAVERLSPIAEQHFKAGEYENNLRLLAKIKPDVDRFFDEVMVMVDDPKIRNNRAALLQELGILMNRVADISKLAVEK